MKRIVQLGGILVMGLASALAAGQQPAAKPDAKQLERGRYLLTVGNCNDCHTAGFGPRNGDVPEKDWLLGDPGIGFKGPWGTTYATNLRLRLSQLTESQWVQFAKGLKTLPPMPWFNLNKWTDEDLRAFYRYVRHLGPAGKPVRQALPPGAKPQTPVIEWPAPPK